jgi:hypothetical protein
MILENITNDRIKLFTYFDAYSQHPEAALAPYLNARSQQDGSKGDKRFPIFLERVFQPYETKVAQPNELLATRWRRKLDEQKLGRILFLERNDSPQDTKGALTRLFLVWLSPAMLEQFRTDPPEKCVNNALVLFHPAGGLDKYPAYWRGDVEPVKTPNFLELGVRYLFKEKHAVLQTLASLSQTMGASKLEAPENQIKLMIVVPVSSAASFYTLSDPALLEEALKEVSRRAYEAAGDKPRLTRVAPPLGRVAVAGYSRSGEILLDLLGNSGRNTRFMEKTLREFYAFDIMLDRRPEQKNPRSKVEGYQLFWSRLKKWQSDDSDRLIRLYSGEPATVEFLRAELHDGLRKYGGGYENPNVPFSSFNGGKAPDGVSLSGLMNGFELYSTDNSRLLACLPFGNSRVYLSSENIKNDHGFHPDEAFETFMEGHTWFISRLLSHALLHSQFW